MGLKEQRERVMIDGLGNVGAGKWTENNLEEPQYIGKIRRTIKTVMLNEDVISYSELSSELRDKFEYKLNQSDNGVSQLIKRELPKLDIVFTDGIGSLNKQHNTVIIRHDIAPKDFAHEIFHEIDVRYKVNQQTDLLTPLQKDWDELLRKSGGDVVGFLMINYHDAFVRNQWGQLVMKSQYSGVSDIINGLSKGKINLGYYHPKRYWKKDGNLQAEAWAQFGATYFENDKQAIKMFCELFTNYNQYAIMTLKGVL